MEWSSRAYPRFPSRPEREGRAEGQAWPCQQVGTGGLTGDDKKPKIQTSPEIPLTSGEAIGTLTPGRSPGVASAVPRGFHICPAYSQRRSNQNQE